MGLPPNHNSSLGLVGRAAGGGQGSPLSRWSAQQPLTPDPLTGPRDMSLQDKWAKEGLPKAAAPQSRQGQAEHRTWAGSVLSSGHNHLHTGEQS